MIFGSLKTKIAVNLAILLLIAMFLIDFIAVSTSQREVLRSEIARGELLISVIKESINFSPAYENIITYSNNTDFISKELDNISILILDRVGKEIYSYYPDSVKQTHLPKLIRQSMSSGMKLNRFLGETLGVFWKQKQNILVTVPVFSQGKVIAGIGISMTMDHFYRGLRQSQQIVVLYILSNAILLTIFGLYRINKIAVRPIHRLVKRAEDYSDDSQTVFKIEKEEDEFRQLSTALNQMLNKISDDKETLKTSLDSLEKANLEIQKAQNDIIRAEKLASVGRLSAGIAHEIGNPIGIVLGYLGLLKQATITDEERSDYINRAEDEINRINTIIRQLLDFSRHSKVEKKPVSIHEIIDEVVDIVNVQPVMKEIEVVMSLDADRDRAAVDPNQFRQVFLNLVINAADAISGSANHDHGRICIKTDVTTEDNANGFQLQMLNIHVTDNGMGISSEHLKNIFDPFFTTKEPGKGTGLGLSVCFMIIEEAGGTITVQSEEGEGSTFIVSLLLH